MILAETSPASAMFLGTTPGSLPNFLGGRMSDFPVAAWRVLSR
jgi:hypothetical protein